MYLCMYILAGELACPGPDGVQADGWDAGGAMEAFWTMTRTCPGSSSVTGWMLPVGAASLTLSARASSMKPSGTMRCGASSVLMQSNLAPLVGMPTLSLQPPLLIIAVTLAQVLPFLQRV